MARQLPAVGEFEEYELGSPDVAFYNLDDRVEARIVSWRLECFMAIPLTAAVSAALAVRKDIDRVDVEEMARRPGITSAQVLELLT